MKKTRIDRVLNKLQYFSLVLVMIFLIGDKFWKFTLNSVIETIVVILLFFISLMIQVYLDIRYKEYTTSTFIFIADIVQLLALLLLCYFEFRSIDVNDFNALWDRSRYISYCRYVATSAILARSFLQSEKYNKNKTDESSEV